MQSDLFAPTKDNFMQQLRSGDKTHCPTCGRYAQIYKRRITSTMAKQLVELVQAAPNGEYVSYRVIKIVGGDWSKLKWWGLIENQSHVPGEDGKKSSGFWRVTQKGFQFLRGEITVPDAMFVFDGEPMSVSPEQVTFSDSLGHHFDYNEIMEGHIVT